MAKLRLWAPAALLVTMALSGCLVNERPDSYELEQEMRADEVASLYNTTSDLLFALSDLPAGVDWVQVALVVTEPVERLGLEVDGLPEDEAVLGVADPRACVEMLYPGLGGWMGYTGEGYTFDSHVLAGPGPDAPSMSGGGSGRVWAFESPQLLEDHPVFIAVDDAAAWVERGRDLEIRVRDGIEVHWRIIDSGTADCVLHFDGYTDGDGGGARALGVGAGAEMYHRWTVPEGGVLSVLFRADIAYHIYVAYQDRYAIAEWDSSTSLAPDGGTFVELDAPGAWGVYAPLLAGKDDTYLYAFLLNR